MGLGFPELCIIGLIVILLFGAGKIADLGKGLGQGIRHFKRGLRDESGDELPLPALPVSALPRDTFRTDLQEGITRHASHRS
jgi:sec-independent protein translocase protein TatA